jgi:hypothetical protein
MSQYRLVGGFLDKILDVRSRIWLNWLFPVCKSAFVTRRAVRLHDTSRILSCLFIVGKSVQLSEREGWGCSIGTSFIVGSLTL